MTVSCCKLPEYQEAAKFGNWLMLSEEFRRNLSLVEYDFAKNRSAIERQVSKCVVKQAPR
ncbi:hypothetical protein A1342_12990 [Methylomonas methanica]|uniref:Uncharacterized protein n=1 Tax=Methylomonas denitrificans TaxID=1538553 RepID=A0A126T313_9GAMM|nr:hypothetical protein JT25_008250 [Methylomonas denitrificans]OAH98741.1 hypothetical protein A1342_12990 [Methylomonas methanica]